MKYEEVGGDIHVPYAAAFMFIDHDVVVESKEGVRSLPKSKIELFYSSEYGLQVGENFCNQSVFFMSCFIGRIIEMARKARQPLVIYFHNLKFDGILLTNHIIQYHKEDLDLEGGINIREGNIYEIAVYKRRSPTVVRRRLLCRIRCSLHLLPCSLAFLAKEICPDMPGKGDMDHANVTLQTIMENVVAYKKYLEHDVKLLAHIMVRAQKIFFALYNVDIVDKTTIAAIAFTIWRMRYHDDQRWKLYIPTKEEDEFIRGAYYGGHVDVYKPYGENLNYYDVNSLYPFIMKTCKMPGGKAIWHDNLCNKKLDDMFGFIKALVHIPKHVKRPFLPFRDVDENALKFGVGYVYGCYFSEELKHAVKLGYDVTPCCGYLFEPIDSPFAEFIDEMYSRRLDARDKGLGAESYIHKLCMNSVYGRLGIKPQSTKAVLCSKLTSQVFLHKKKGKVIQALPMGEYNLITYKENVYDESDGWKPPVNTCPQISACITGYARIYMDQFVSRDDCLYTDTDSVVLENPLPESMVSDRDLGKFKLEYGVIRRAIFAAPKSYFLEVDGGKDVKKFKGAPTGVVEKSHFVNLLNNVHSECVINYEKNFSVDWKNLVIRKRMSQITMKLGGSKRILVFKRGVWVDTKPYVFTSEDFFKMLKDQPTGSLILRLWEDNKRLKDAAELSRVIREELNKGKTCEDDSVDKSDSIEVKDQGGKKGTNKKGDGANKKGTNKKGANKKGGNKKGSDKKKGLRSSKNDGSRSSNKKEGDK